MLKLIDTDELCEALKKRFEDMDVDQAKSAIRDAENHQSYACAKWIKAGKPYIQVKQMPPYLYFRCSHCNSVFANSNKDNYCRNCGAAMQVG